MHSNWSLWVSCFLAWLSQCLGDRLVLPPGGYARVTQPLTNHLESFTLSAWVNITHFTEGITPILTYINQDASSQVSFFMRPSGVGVLWGGPILKDRKVDLISRINRRPRLYWSDFSSKIRRRRGTDYSEGLGDIVNILERSGRAENSWAPSNFVDVGVMGVDDLMVSGSEDQDSIIIPEARRSRAQTYSQWTNVPYELHMQESIQSHVPKNYPKEPRIITQPSGGDDFVFFNWNFPQHNQQRIPLGSNSWSPIWDPTKKPANSPLSPTLQKPAQVNLPVKQTQDPNQPWASQVHKVDISNEWNPVGFEEGDSTAENRPEFKTKLLPTNVERPIWPSNIPNNVAIGSDLPSRNRISTNAVEPNEEFKGPSLYEIPTASFSNILPIIPVVSKPTTHIPSTIPATIMTTTTTETTTTTHKTTTSKPTTRRNIPYKKHKPTPFPRRKIVPTFRTTTLKGSHQTAEMEDITQKTPLKRERTRTPLWMLIKKPGEAKSQSPVETKPKVTNTKIQPQRTVVTNNQRRLYRYSLNDFQKNSKPKTRPSHPSPFNTKRPRPPPDRFQISFSNNKNTYIQKPHRSTINKHTITTQRPPTTTTAQPETTTKIKRVVPLIPSIPKIRPPISDPTRYNRRNPWSSTTKYKKVTVASFLKGEDEFSKTMKDPKLIQEGNTAVIYAIPIQDEDEFYKMYKKYQEETEKPNIHKLYQKMRKGGASDTQIQEEEENENILQQGVKLTEFDKILSQTDLSVQATNEPVSKVVQATPLVRGDIQPETLDVLAFNNGLKSSQSDNENAEYEYDQFTEGDLLIPGEDQYDYYYSEETTLNTENNVNIKPVSVINEGSAPYFIPDNDNDGSLADLYRGAINVVKQENAPTPSLYQEPSSLSHQQLPPTYQKSDKAVILGTKDQNRIASVSGIQDTKSFPQLIYSANPQDLIAQGLLPRPIHAVDTQEEADRWMNQQKHQRFTPQELLNQPTVNTQLNIPQTPFIQRLSPVKVHHNIPLAHQLPFPLHPSQLQNERSSTDTANQMPIEGIIQPRVPDGFLNSPTEDETEEDEVPLSIKIKELPYKFNPNGWYHIGFTWNGQSKKMFVYVNGEVLGEITEALKDRTHIERGGLFLLGRTLLPDLSDFDESSQFLGEISDLNLSTKELTPREMDLSFQCKNELSKSLSLQWGDAHMNLYNGATMKKSPQFCGLIS